RAGLRGPEPVTVQRGPFVFRGLDRSRADLILAVDGRPVHCLDDLLAYVESRKPGERVVLTALRGGRKVEVPVTLEQARDGSQTWWCGGHRSKGSRLAPRVGRHSRSECPTSSPLRSL